LGASAQSSSQAPSRIYTCIDAQGQRLTSDRPIIECIDREQRELSSTGIVLRVIPPSLSAAEREARAARERDAALERQRERGATRRDQALLARYPDKAAHEDGRRQALAQTQTTVDAIERGIVQLTSERKTLDDELEFYRKDPSKTPARLRHAIEDNAQAMQEQRRVMASQQDEIRRIDARFDEEARRLQPLWNAKTAGTASAQP
jgi:chromosome segregation ATPase